MNELKQTKLAKPIDKQGSAAELMTLRETVAFMNDPRVTGAQVPKEAKEEIAETLSGPSGARGETVIASDPVLSALPPMDEIKKHNPPNPRPVSNGKVFFTGKIAVGKDYCAKALDAKILGFADPLYALANHFFDSGVSASTGKDIPGVRQFLQTVGQWGRGQVDATYPLSPLRAVFITMVRSLASAGALPADMGVDWLTYGMNPDIWLNATLERSKSIEGRLAITNVRFENEFKRLVSEGWEHWHVLCSPQCWTGRLQLLGLTATSPQLKDASEGLANFLDNDVTKKLSSQRNGPKLRVIWNDQTVKIPSPRLYTVAEFLQERAIADL